MPFELCLQDYLARKINRCKLWYLLECFYIIGQEFVLNCIIVAAVSRTLISNQAQILPQLNILSSKVFHAVKSEAVGRFSNIAMMPVLCQWICFLASVMAQWLLGVYVLSLFFFFMSPLQREGCAVIHSINQYIHIESCPVTEVNAFGQELYFFLKINRGLCIWVIWCWVVALERTEFT